MDQRKGTRRIRDVDKNHNIKCNSILEHDQEVELLETYYKEERRGNGVWKKENMKRKIVSSSIQTEIEFQKSKIKLKRTIGNDIFNDNDNNDDDGEFEKENIFLEQDGDNVVFKIPLEIWEKITSYLSIDDRLKCSLTCKQLYLLIHQNPFVWSKLNFSDLSNYNYIVNNSLDSNNVNSFVSHILNISKNSIETLILDSFSSLTDSSLNPLVNVVDSVFFNSVFSRRLSNGSSNSSNLKSNSIESLPCLKHLELVNLTKITSMKLLSLSFNLGKNLSYLNFSGMLHFNDKCFQLIIAKCRFLKHLNLSKTSITGSNLPYDKLFPKSQDIRKKLSYKNITVLNGLPYLRYLDVSKTYISSSFGKFIQHLPKLEQLHLNMCLKSSSSIFFHIISPFLYHVSLSGSSILLEPSNILLPNLKILINRCSRLKNIDFQGCKTLNSEIYLQIGLKCGLKLEDLNLSMVPTLTDDNLLSITSRSLNLKKLNVSWCQQLTPSGICLNIENLNNLESLDLSHTYINYSIFDVLLNLKNKKLNELILDHCDYIEGGHLINFIKSLIQATIVEEKQENNDVIIIDLEENNQSLENDDNSKLRLKSGLVSLRVLSINNCSKISVYHVSFLRSLLPNTEIYYRFDH